MRSNPPRKHAAGTDYYELLVTADGRIQLARYSRAPAPRGAPIAAQLTHEVLVRLAGDFRRGRLLVENNADCFEPQRAQRDAEEKEKRRAFVQAGCRAMATTKLIHRKLIPSASRFLCVLRALCGKPSPFTASV